MNFLLKIVEGPNQGAEIALVEGVAITLGKLDECDIVLADPTLPDAPFTIEATASGVTLNGSAVEPFHVKTVGSTAFAVGPADAAWGELVRESEPARAEADQTPGEKPDEGAAVSGDAQPPAEEPTESASEAAPESAPRHRRSCLGCLLWLIVLLLILASLGWFFRDTLRPQIERLLERTGMTEGTEGPRSGAAEGGADAQERVPPRNGLSAIAAKYGLALTNDMGRVTLSGNLRTRAERLAATAEAYAEQPGVDLDLSDDESFGTAAADALFTLTEGALKVRAATNRVVAITGVSQSSAALKKTLEMLNDDLPRLRNVDVSGVKFRGIGSPILSQGQSVSSETRPGGSAPRRVVRRESESQAAPAEPNFPVCGILTMPYPCLVMKNGTRIFEGATIGDSTILKITSDSVVVTNANGRFTWKP